MINLKTFEYFPHHRAYRELLYPMKSLPRKLKIILWMLMVILLAFPFQFPFHHQDNSSSPTTLPNWGQMPLVFIANQGQMDARIGYYLRASDKWIAFTSTGVTFTLQKPQSKNPYLDRIKQGLSVPTLTAHSHHGGRASLVIPSTRQVSKPSQPYVFRWDFIGANSVFPQGRNRSETVVSYFKNTPDKWLSGIPTYSQILYPNLWKGIDLVYRGTVSQLKYEFIVHPGAEPGFIRWAFRGADLHLTRKGQLQINTPAGVIYDEAPTAYQMIQGKQIPVSIRYIVQNGTEVRFKVGSYDPAYPLIIDPSMLVYCGFIGGYSGDWGTAIAVDSQGYAYVTGYAFSNQSSFPDGDGFGSLPGYDQYFNGGDSDAFVVKVRADGTGLVYATYLGGSNNDAGTGIAVDNSGNAYIVGVTESSNFPVQVGPDLLYNGDQDAFITKLNPDGTGLVYSGFLGGIEADIPRGVVVDSSGSAYIVGQTYSTEATFPANIGPDVSFNGYVDAFVAKVLSSGSGLAYAGYIGGTNSENGYGIAVDAQGNAVVTGETWSSEASFPVTIGPDLTFNGGGLDAFVAKVNQSGSSLLYAGYIGGSSYEAGYDVALDQDGNAYVTGYTRSTQTTFPDGDGFGSLVGPDKTHNGGDDVFVVKVNAGGDSLLYAGYIGGSNGDEGWGIAVDSIGNAYVAGFTQSFEATFPEVVGPDLTYNGGYSDAFVAKVNRNGSALEYAGYVGGSDRDQAWGIDIDPSGNAYITGETASTQSSFPVVVGPDLTHNAYDPTSYNGFVAKIYYPNPITEHKIPTSDSEPYGIAPDNNNHLWFAESGANKIGKLAFPSGSSPLEENIGLASTGITEFDIPTAGSAPTDIVLGPDGNLWFTEYLGNKIGKITPAGVITEYALPNSNSGPIAITVGPDNNLWFCEDMGNRIGKMNTAGTVLAEYPLPSSGSELNDIVSGPDGNLWFTEYSGKRVGKITTSGVITEYSVGAKAYGITVGGDGALWFTLTIADQVGKITTSGQITYFDLPGDNNGPMGIVAGPHNSLWVVANFTNKILRLLLTGVVLRDYEIPTSASGALFIAVTTDGRLWFTEMQGNKIGELTPSGGSLYLPLIIK